MFTLSTFNKQCIYNCYCLMKDVVSSENIEDNDYLCDKMHEIEKYKITMPEELYAKIDAFIMKNIAPIAEPDFWQELQKPEYGETNQKGCFEVNSEESLKSICGLFMKRVFELNQIVDSFAEKELRPYLI